MRLYFLPARSSQIAAGYSLVELLVVIGILVLIAALSYSAYVAMLQHKTLDADGALIVAELSQARSLTLSGESGDQWGVHFASTSVTLFEGASYSAGASGNVVTSFDSADSLFSITLAGGGSDVLFQRLTGETAQSGAITLALVASSTQTKTVTIYPTGIAEIQ